jgi:hypothetical protein
MKALHAVLAVLAAAATATAVAAAGPAVTKQRVAINVKSLPGGTFVLTPLSSGALKRDSGTFRGEWQNTGRGEVVRNGQKVYLHTLVWTVNGHRGTLTIRDNLEWVETGSDGNRDGVKDGIGIGTWKVVRGTGAYARIAGGGGSGHALLGHTWNARYEGLLTVP